MNIIAENGFILNVNTEENVKYYSTHTLCNCTACRYFYNTVGSMYPHAERLLKRLGSNISKPDELEYWETTNNISYSAHYTIIGSTVSFDSDCFEADGIKIVLHPSRQPDFYIPNEQITDEYFIISLYGINIKLPPYIN